MSINTKTLDLINKLTEMVYKLILNTSLKQIKTDQLHEILFLLVTLYKRFYAIYKAFYQPISMAKMQVGLIFNPHSLIFEGFLYLIVKGIKCSVRPSLTFLVHFSMLT